MTRPTTLDSAVPRPVGATAVPSAGVGARGEPATARADRGPTAAFVRTVAPPLALACLAAAAFLPFLHTGFPGTDSLTLVDTSRVASWPDLAALLIQPVMAGTTFAQAEVVYRPFVSLTFALDYAVWGLDDVGFHLTNLAIHVIATLGVWALLRSFRLSRPASFVGALLFGLHPSVISAVPVVARRDSLVPVAAFVWSMALLVRAAQPGRKSPLWSTGSCILFAIALLSKESAFAAALLVPVVLYAATVVQAGARRPALRDWARRLGPYVAIGTAAFVLRMAVLRSLGGYEGTAITTFDADAYTILLAKFVRFLFWPVAGVFAAWPARWLVLLGALVALSAAALCALARKGGLAVAVGYLWVLVFALFHVAVKTFTGAWLVYFPLVGLALIAAGLFDALGAAVRPAGPVTSRRKAVLAVAAGSPAAAGAAAFAVATIASSSLFTAYPEWDAAGGISTHYLAADVDCVRDAPDGTVLTLSNVPNALDYPSTANDLLAPTLVNDHTVESQLKMVLPSRRYTVAVSSYGVVKSPVSQVSTACTGTGSTRELTATY